MPSNAQIDLIEHALAKSRQAASERAPSETAGPAKVVAAEATGSLPASSAVVLRWLAKEASFYDSLAAEQLDQVAAMEAERLRLTAKELRRHLVRANVRQPEENK